MDNKSVPVKKAHPSDLKPYLFKPGQSGNPLGSKPNHTLVSRIKSVTSNGMEMADVMIKIMRGQKIKGVWGTPSYKDVINATTWLAEQVFGKAPLTISESNGSTYELQKLLYIELKGHKDVSGVFDIPEGTVLEQDLENPEPVQDPNKKQGSGTV